MFYLPKLCKIYGVSYAQIWVFSIRISWCEFELNVFRFRSWKWVWQSFLIWYFSPHRLNQSNCDQNNLSTLDPFQEINDVVCELSSEKDEIEDPRNSPSPFITSSKHYRKQRTWIYSHLLCFKQQLQQIYGYEHKFNTHIFLQFLFQFLFLLLYTLTGSLELIIILISFW